MHIFTWNSKKFHCSSAAVIIKCGANAKSPRSNGLLLLLHDKKIFSISKYWTATMQQADHAHMHFDSYTYVLYSYTYSVGILHTILNTKDDVRFHLLASR